MQAVRGQLDRLDPELAGRLAKKVAVFGVTRRLLRSVPLLGPSLAAYAGYSNVKRKGWVRGGVDTALDLTPVVGSVKAVVELFRGELIEPADPALKPSPRQSG